MSENLYEELNDRSKQIFKSVVETYLKTGSPSGSETIMKKAGINLSSSSIRAILSNLQKEGLYSHHTHLLGVCQLIKVCVFVDGLLNLEEFPKQKKKASNNNACQKENHIKKY